MGNLFFIFMHLLMVLIFPVGLIFTIPVHMIYASGKRREKLLRQGAQR